MKLPIEVWIEQRNPSQNVSELFGEAVICYRNKAYRASYILSYLGFLTIVKDVMLLSHPPTGFVAGEWQAKLTEIQNHEKWEEAVYDSLQQGTKAGVKPIFRLNDDIRQQLAFWRSRRNDAAHYKNNEIGGHHTEALWSFIKSNVPKMAVDGGMVGLLNKFMDHFDDTKTPPGSDFTPLVREIPLSMVATEYQKFFDELRLLMEGKYWFMDDKYYQIINEIFNLTDTPVLSNLQTYLKMTNFDLRFLTLFPNRLLLMGYSAIEMRQLWKTRIWTSGATNPYTITAELLREGQIPPAEIPLLNQDLFDKSRDKLPRTTDIPTLGANGYFDVVYNEAITNQDLKWFKWANAHADIIAMMIEYCPLRDETVGSICRMADSEWPSEWLIERLVRIFAEKPLIKTAFAATATRLGITVPAKIS